jgi:hypothetical protein
VYAIQYRILAVLHIPHSPLQPSQESQSVQLRSTLNMHCAQLSCWAGKHTLCNTVHLHYPD